MRTLGYAIAIALSTVAGLAGALSSGHLTHSHGARVATAKAKKRLQASPPLPYYVLLAPGDAINYGLNPTYYTNVRHIPTRLIPLSDGFRIQTHGDHRGPTMIVFGDGHTVVVLPHSVIKISLVAQLPVAENEALKHEYRAMRFAGAGNPPPPPPPPPASVYVQNGGVQLSSGVVNNGNPPPAGAPNVVVGTKNTGTATTGSTALIMFNQATGKTHIFMYDCVSATVNVAGHYGMSVPLVSGQELVVTPSNNWLLEGIPPNLLIP